MGTVHNIFVFRAEILLFEIPVANLQAFPKRIIVFGKFGFLVGGGGGGGLHILKFGGSKMSIPVL